MFILVTVLVVVWFGIVPRYQGFQPVPIAFLVVAWAWLFGGNYAFSRYRFPRLLRAGAERGLRERTGAHAAQKT